MICKNCGAENLDTARYCKQCGKVLAAAAEPHPNPVLSSPPLPAPARPVVYAGFWRRVAATLIDTIPLAIMSWIIGSATRTPSMVWWDVESAADLRGFVLGAIIAWIYYALSESSRVQATLGKMIIGIYVTDESGRRITFGKATGRHFGKYVSGVILGIGFLMAGFTAKKQGLHDILAGTLVVKHTH